MSDEPLHNPHDRFFKETLGRKETAAGFFREFLPAALVRDLDWADLTRVESRFVDETLRERHSDLLFTVPWKGREILLYCLFEHQSGSDRWMAFRLLRYMVGVWEEQLRAEPGRAALSPILPLVLHQGKRRWKVSLRFASLVELPAELETELAKHVPDFRYGLVDLADWPMADIRGAAAVGAILATMKMAVSGELVERLPEVSQILSRLFRDGDVGLVRVCLEYLMRGSGDIDLPRFRANLEELKIPEIRKDAMTIADQWIEEGVQKGLQKGRQEGRQEEGRAILRRLLSRRFGILPDWTVDRLNGASVQELEEWSDRLFDAPDLETVFEK